MPLRSLRAAGPSVDTRRMPGVGSVEEDPVAASYVGGGSSGCRDVDMGSAEYGVVKDIDGVWRYCWRCCWLFGGMGNEEINIEESLFVDATHHRDTGIRRGATQASKRT